MMQYNHQIKKGNDNMNKPKITLDELIEIAFSYDSLNSHKVLDYLYREDFKDALDDVDLDFLNILQKYNTEEREIILDNARNLSANEMIYQIRLSMRIVQKMSETLELSEN